MTTEQETVWQILENDEQHRLRCGIWIMFREALISRAMIDRAVEELRELEAVGEDVHQVFFRVLRVAAVKAKELQEQRIIDDDL